MKYLIVSCVFGPEPVVSARTSTDIADELCRRGHQVRVITSFPNRPAGRLYKGYKRRLWAHDRSFIDYDVLRCFSLFSSQSSLLSRFLENLSFGVISGFAVLFSGKPDAIYGNTWPIFAQGILALICFLRGIPLVMSVQDIYPETLFAQGRASKLQFFYAVPLRWLDKKIAQSCAAVVVISEQFRKIYTGDRELSTQRVYLIPNWMDEHRPEFGADDQRVREKHNIPLNAFLVVYAGNIGFASGLDRVILAFQKLNTRTCIYLLIAGAGSMLVNYQELARSIDNPRICFHTPWLESETSSLLCAANLLILPTQGEQAMFSVPSKLISYMLAGRPILSCVNNNSEVARIIHVAQCGWTIPSPSPEMVFEKLAWLAERPPQELEEYGKRGREYALREMTRLANLPKFINLMDKITGCT